MGIEAIGSGDGLKAQEHFNNAEKCFQSAKHGEFPNVYAYHAHSNMWYQKGNRTRDDAEKLECYAKSIEILTVAKDNVNEDDLQAIFELETMLWGQLRDEEKIRENIEVLRQKYNTPRGYYLNAQLIFRQASEKEGDEKNKLLRKAFQNVEAALEFFPSDEHCLQLKAKMIKEIEPNDLKEYFKVLQTWKAASSMPNVWLLYELGRTAFMLKYYDLSKETFRELETGIGIGHKLRSRSSQLIVDESGKKKEFIGRIIDKFSPYEGEIRCETLRSLRYSIAFRPIACKFTPCRGDQVKFYIGFSFRGPIAVNVLKI